MQVRYSLRNQNILMIRRNPGRNTNIIHTLKVLISVRPNLFINFVSNAYKDGVSDKKQTLRSQYLEKLTMYSTIMADKGFNIENECLSYNLSLYNTPGKKERYQIVPSAMTKIKKIANTQILVEQVI